METDTREALRHQQERLLKSIHGEASLPEGFNAERVALTAITLVNKRRRIVERTWPGLEGMLNGSLADCFSKYGREHAPPAGGDAVRDAIGFLEFLHREGKLTEELSLQWLRYRGRRGVAFAALSVSRAFAFAVRLPGLGVRVVRLRRPRTRGG